MRSLRRGDRPAGTRPARWLALAALALAAAVVACGARSVPLAELAVEMERYDGDEITTSGVVVEFDETDGALERHFVIQDASDNRVQLLPDEVAEPHAGSAVTVTGEFEFDPERGRLLHVETIEPAG